MRRSQHGEVWADEGGAHAVALAHRSLELGTVPARIREGAEMDGSL